MMPAVRAFCKLRSPEAQTKKASRRGLAAIQQTTFPKCAADKLLVADTPNPFHQTEGVLCADWEPGLFCHIIGSQDYLLYLVGFYRRSFVDFAE